MRAALAFSLLSLEAVTVGGNPRAGTGVFEPWLQELLDAPGPANAAPELRVAKGLGTKGYNKVRISVVAPQLLDVTDFNFTYKQQFRHRWTDNFLHSALVDLVPGPNTLSIGGQSVTVDLPAEGAGIRGVFWSDPCFSSKWVSCAYADRFQTFEHSIAMLNAAFADPSLNVFGILGDNFYDQTGELTKTLFARLSPDVKRRFMIMVNGNHDNWVCGSPGCGTPQDNFGIGQMQYYPADSVASSLAPQDDANFLDFSVDPDARAQWTTWQNVGTNFVVYHKLGNVGFLSFSGAAGFNDLKPHFQEACQYFEQSKPAVVFLLGHWNGEGMGCGSGMATPELRGELLALPGCSALGERLKYMDGHEHCNYIQERGAEPFGFMIGAHGMDDKCEAQFGFVYLDSTDGRVRLYYFEVASHSKGDRFQALLSCVQANGGLPGCVAGFAETWLDVPAASLAVSDANSSISWV
eukprot:gb/GFBE01030478.1/.p1 GENE.gb/GFBE01030478.1/~~gb/GFBE01030478.1/.p1  ORF type:complete len:465 (+),score=107.55 gb/GFBE01030478.1/:1-1395(+)